MSDSFQTAATITVLNAQGQRAFHNNTAHARRGQPVTYLSALRFVLDENT